MKINRLLLLGGAISVVCLFAKVTTDYDHKANFGNYHNILVDRGERSGAFVGRPDRKCG